MNANNKTIGDVVKQLKAQGVSSVLTNRIERLSKQFATPEAFFSAQKSEIMKAYTRVSNSTEYSLGKAFWNVYDTAIGIYRYAGNEKAIQEMVKPEETAREEDPRLYQLMKLEDLRTVVSFMELCDVHAINIVEIVGFLGAVKMRQKGEGSETVAEKQEQK